MDIFVDAAGAWDRARRPRMTSLGFGSGMAHPWVTGGSEEGAMVCYGRFVIAFYDFDKPRVQASMRVD